MVATRELGLILEFTPLEFETTIGASGRGVFTGLEFTPLEFETI